MLVCADRESRACPTKGSFVSSRFCSCPSGVDSESFHLRKQERVSAGTRGQPIWAKADVVPEQVIGSASGSHWTAERSRVPYTPSGPQRGAGTGACPLQG